MSVVCDSNGRGVGADNPLNMTSMQKKVRYNFPGTSLDTSKWTLVKKDSGITVSVTGGELQIAMGTTVGEEFILETNEVFTDPFRAMLGFMFTTATNGQEFNFEVVSVDPSTKVYNGQDSAGFSFRLKDDNATLNYYGRHYTKCDGGAVQYSTPVSISASYNLLAYGIIDLEMFPDEVWYHSRLVDSTSGRLTSFVRQMNIPNPNSLYKIRIRGKNVSATTANTMKISFLTVVDYTELTAEITAGRGSQSTGQSVGVVANGGALSVTTCTTAYVAPKMVTYADSTANVANGSNYTSTARDTGSTPTYNAFNVKINSDKAGRLDVYQGSSATTASNKICATYNIVANTPLLISVPIVARYAGFKFSNTDTATTTVFEALSSLTGV